MFDGQLGAMVPQLDASPGLNDTRDSGGWVIATGRSRGTNPNPGATIGSAGVTAGDDALLRNNQYAALREDD